MPKIFSAGNHNSKEFEDCRPLSPVQSDLHNRLRKACSPSDPEPCEDTGRWKPKGFAPLCDLQKTGAIVNDISDEVRRREVYRYANNIGACNEAMMKLFSNIIVTDTNNKIHPIPIIPGTQEKAVAWLMAEHARKDNTLVVGMPVLPVLALHQSDISYDPARYTYHKALMPGGKIISEDRENDTILRTSRGIPVNISYTLYAWTEFKVDMHQILTQIYTKCCPATYIEIKGDPWETMVRLDSSADNKDIEVQDQKLRVIKYQFYLTVETYISEPIVRDKMVLGIATDFVNSVDENKLTEVYGRIEIEENGN